MQKIQFLRMPFQDKNHIKIKITVPFAEILRLAGLYDLINSPGNGRQALMKVTELMVASHNIDQPSNHIMNTERLV